MIEFTAETQRMQREVMRIGLLVPLTLLLGLSLLVSCRVNQPNATPSTLREQEEADSQVEAEQRTPTQTAEAFVSALQTGDVDAARAMLALDANLTDPIQDEITEKLNRMVDSLAHGARMTPLGELIDTDCAVLMVHDQTPRESRATIIDVDPMPMVSRGGTWLLLLDDPIRRSNVTALTVEQQSRFRELLKLYDVQKPKLQAKLKGERTQEN